MNHLKLITFAIALLSFATSSNAQLIAEKYDAERERPPFELNKAGLTNLNLSPYTTAYITEDVLLINNSYDYQLFHIDGRPLVEGKWRNPGSDNDYPRMDKGAMIVKKADTNDEKLYIIKKDGTVTALPATYKTATHFRDGVAIVRLQGKTPYSLGKAVFIDQTGKQLPSPPNLSTQQRKEINDGVRNIAPLRDGMRAYFDEEAKKWGYCDEHGKVVIPPTFTEARSFSDGLACVSKDGKTFFINKQGNQANPLSFKAGWSGSTNIVSDYSGGVCVANEPNNFPDKLRTYYNHAGELVGQLKTGSPMFNGKIYYLDKSTIEEDKKSNRTYMSSQVGHGEQITNRSTMWFPLWDGYTILPRFDEAGVGHTDNHEVFVGVQPKQNRKYKYPYRYLSDFSSKGYALANMKTKDATYYGVVDLNGKFVCLIAIETN